MLIYFKNKQLNKSTKANKKRFAERKTDDPYNSTPPLCHKIKNLI